MRRNHFLICFFVCSYSFSQTLFEGEWITRNRRLNNHLCVFKNPEVYLEDYYKGQLFKISFDTLIIYSGDLRENFKIETLTKDSITLLPIYIKEFEIIDGVKYEVIRARGISRPLKLIKRDLLYKLINFDSIVYSSKSRPYYTHSYYSPAVEIISKLTKDGWASFFRHETDSLKPSDLGNRKKIEFSDEDLNEINNAGKISPALLSEFMNQLNNCNIESIDMDRDFRSYRHQIHCTHSKIEVYQNGMIKYKIESCDYPDTLKPIVNFMEELNNKLK